MGFDEPAEASLWCGRRCLEIVVRSAAPVLLRVLLFHRFVAQNAKREVRDAEAAQDDHRREEHCFVGNGLDERVEDLGESVRGDFGAGDYQWVLVRDAFPFGAHGLQSRDAVAGRTAVFVVLLLGLDDFGDYVGACFEGFSVDVAAHCGPEAVDDVGAAGEEEDVEE